MKKRKNLFIGIMFIIAAVSIIAHALGAFGQIGFWTLVLTPFFVAKLIVSICKLSWSGILFSLAFLAILFDEMLGIEMITPWPVLFAALFGSIGINMVFAKHKVRKSDFEVKYANDKEELHPDSNYEYEHFSKSEKSDKDLFAHMEHFFKSEIAFGNVTKYIQCQSLEKGVIENAFGHTTIYLDNARLHEGKAVIKVENAFGEVKLFIPKEWHVSIDIEKFLGNFEIYGTCATESENTLHIKGDSSFGKIKIHYV